MADLEGNAREPLAGQEQPTAKCSRCRLLSAVAVILVLAAAVGVGYYFLVQRPLECHIDSCSQVILPNNARSCTEARCGSCIGLQKLTPAVDSQGGYCGLVCGLPHCAEHVVAARSAQNCSDTTASLHCGRCDPGWDFELDRKTLEPTGNCSFSCTAAQEQAGCAPHSCTEDGTCGGCRPGFRHAAARDGGSCAKETASAAMTFYMYRAQSDQNYPPENCDLASAAGVIWYLHNEVVKMCPRHYNISRILRYNVTVFNPPSTYAVRQGQFGHFVQFDYGQCTVPDCKENWWDKYGYMVGCQQQDQTMWKYKESYWYSLPGRCPSQKWSNKSQECTAEEAGGNCSAPNGTSTCTWHAEAAGEVSVDELSGISNIAAFCAAGNVEYDEKTDRGRGCSFWDDKFNATRNKERVMAMHRLFAKHVPTEDALAMPAPLCDGF